MVLTGSARAVQDARENAAELSRRWEADRKAREQKRKKTLLEARIAALRAEFDAESEELSLMAEEEQKRQTVLVEDRLEMAHLRKGKPTRKSVRKGSGKGA
ncbi:MAG: hypothetical protein AB7S77_21965 [Desulfatirhabdiaceae bacterium]